MRIFVCYGLFEVNVKNLAELLQDKSQEGDFWEFIGCWGKFCDFWLVFNCPNLTA
jgi:hypothetical protein